MILTQIYCFLLAQPFCIKWYLGVYNLPTNLLAPLPLQNLKFEGIKR